MDVTDASSVEQAFAAAETRFGPVTIVINNAGVTATRPALDMTENDWSIDRSIPTSKAPGWSLSTRRGG